MMSNAVTVTGADFDAVVLKNDVPVLVDFWAPWCGPCRRVGPELDAVSEELGAQVVIAKVNVDDESELAVTYGIQSIPAMVIFKGGKEVDRLVGAYPRTAISAKLKAQL
jgi:thioredoxin 1